MNRIHMFYLRLLKIPYLMVLNAKLNVFGVEYGEGVRGNRIFLKNKGRIIVGDRVSLNSYPDGALYRTGLLCHCDDSVISIGDDCNLNGVMIHCRDSVSIGKYCMFGPGSSLVDNDSHRISIDVDQRRRPPVSMPITIEDNVWVGMGATILKGVRIGENSIVAANSVVTKSFPGNVLVAGNPAKIIKELGVELISFPHEGASGCGR